MSSRLALQRRRFGGAALALIAFAFGAAGVAVASPGISGWSQIASMEGGSTSEGGTLPLRLVGHSSFVDDSGRTHVAGGTIYYPEPYQIWGNDNLVSSPDWKLVGSQDLHTAMDLSQSTTFSYAGRWWYLGAYRNQPSAGMCLWSKPDHPGGELWKLRSCDLPKRIGHSAVVANGYVYIIGGLRSASTTIHELSTSYAKLHTDGTVGPWRWGPFLPESVFGGDAVYAGGRIFAFGEWSHPVVVSASVNSDGSLGAWRNETSIPSNVDGEAVAVGNDIYLIGGAPPTDAVSYASVAPDGTLGPWQQSAHPLPEPLSQHAAVANGNQIIVTGGMVAGTGDARDRARDWVLSTTSSSVPSNQQLLARYSPELRYDNLETYRASSAAMATDNCLLDAKGKVARQNYLDRTKHLAAACPIDKLPDLKLDYLSAYTATSGDRIDLANEYLEDAQRLHADGDYRNHTYGRVIDYPDGSKVLQYWLFYYNNPKGYLGFGVHEGDWELVQVHLDSALSPSHATFAQHHGGERCEWVHVQRTAADRPIVYVAEGSHAGYFSDGYHFNDFGDDFADGAGEHVIPTVMDVTVAPLWLYWPGRWGGSTNSPTSPSQQGSKWSDPAAWSVSVDGCTEGQTQAQAATRTPRLARRPPVAPPVPKVVARRRGSRVVVSYRFAEFPTGERQRPWQILASVESGGGHPPMTYRSQAHRHGVIRHGLGLGGALTVCGSPWWPRGVLEVVW